MEFVFVIVTSKTCGHCLTFKQQHLKNLLSNLSDIKKLHIIEISYPERTVIPLSKQIKSFVGDPTNNPEIQRYNSSDPVIFYLKGGNIGVNPKITKSIKGFPQFFLFSKDTWQDQNGALIGLVFGGTFNPDGTVENSKTGQPFNSETLTKWIHVSMMDYSSKIITESNKKTPNITSSPGYVAPSTWKMKIKSFNNE